MEDDEVNRAFFEKLHCSKTHRNLSQIFEDDIKPMQSESKNLRYQPQSSHKLPEPDQTEKTVSHKKKSHASSQRCTKRELVDGTWKTLMAVVAEGFKGNDNCGRVGFALLQNEAGAAQLMVYKNKGKILSNVLLTKSKTSSSPRVGRYSVIKRETYFQFFDEDGFFWSVHIMIERDEYQFIKELKKIGVNLNEKQTGSEVLAALAASPVLSINEDSDDTLSGEDVIDTANCERQPTMEPVQACSTVSVSGKPQVTLSKLETFLEEQRATSQSIEQKMDLILQTFWRLAQNSNSSLTHLKGGGDSSINSILHGNTKLGNEQVETSTLRSKISENEEDVLIELEQKILDHKRENRALHKLLKAKDQALEDLRTSTGNLCDELATQNSELKQQNNSLITAMSAMNHARYDTNNIETCRNCEYYLNKVFKLERQVNQLLNDLRNCKPNEGGGLTVSAPH